MTTLYKFQEEDVERLVSLGGRGLVASCPGTGKSLVALVTAHNLDAFPMVVVCPASIKYSWQQQVLEHLGMRAEVLETTRPPKRSMGKPKIVIVNYDILGQRRGEHAGTGWIPYLKKLNPRLVVIDETHMLGNPQSRRTRWVRSLCHSIPHVLALSGTPLTNRPAELWPTLNILHPDRFPSFWSFAQRFCGIKRTRWGYDTRGSSNLDELHKLLLPLLVRRRKVDVLKDLPLKRRIVTPLALPLVDRKEYDRAKNNFLGWIKERDPGRLPKAEQAEKLVQLGRLKQLVGELKLPLVIDWLDDFLEQTDEKVILFAVHRKVIAPLREHYSKGCVVVDGSVSNKDRQLAVEAFLHKKRVRVFIGNIKAAGVGWSAPGVRTVVFAELPWTPGDVEQCIDRTHGIGRGVKGEFSEAVFLIAHDTVEDHLAKIIQAKMGVLTQTLDGIKGSNALSIHDELVRALQGDRKR